jgi:hypothetical protein
LREVVEAVLQPIHTRELAVKRIEAPILLVNNHDVLDVGLELLGQGSLLRVALLRHCRQDPGED